MIESIDFAMLFQKEFANAKAPEKNYVLQESSTTGITVGEEITISSIKSNRNSRIVFWNYNF